TFQSVADIQTHDMLNLPKPDLKNGKAEIIVSEISPYQERLMQEFAERAEMIRAGAVQPYEDNMLKVTHEAKLMAIDSRLLDEAAPVDENAKLFKCAENVHRIWEETTAQKSTQIIFSDSGTPKKDVFNVYDEIKHLLIEKGIPADQVAFIHDCNNDQQRETLFEKVRRGEVRVLLGSTGKLGTGTNVQNKLIAG
ncbi:helicase, partial [Listeria monocytogenes]